MMPSVNGNGSNNSEPVQVIVRIRPEPPSISSNPLVVARDERSVALLPLPAPPPDPMTKTKPITEMKTFTFDKVYHPRATQAEVYDFARPLIMSAVDGYNSTIFAYGHTGSGKTHTMMGTSTQPGMTPRAVQEMFNMIRRMAAREPDTIFIVRMSYVELYNNQFRNLLEGSQRGEDNGWGNSVGFGSSVGAGRGGWMGEADSVTEGPSLRSSWRSMNGTTTTATLASSMSASMSTSGGGDGGGHLASRSFDGSLASLAASSGKASNRTAVAARTGKIEVRECPEAGVFLSGPGLRRAVTSAEEALRLVSKGDATRATAATDCNEHSSRSHAILSFHVESQRVDLASSSGTSSGRPRGSGSKSGGGGGGVRLGKLHLVDLAGSERLSLSGSEGKRLNETQNINLSLSSLGNVLACLSRNATIIARRSTSTVDGAGTGETVAPVPYRSSKLTHFLKDSLGGNSKTLMVTTLRSTAMYHRQSLISLLYASRAKKIRNQSCVNVDTAGQSNIHQVSADIEALKNRLQQRSVELHRLSTSHEDGRAENAALRQKLQGLSSANERERAQLEGKLSTVIHSQAGKLAVQHQAFVTLQARLQRQLGEYQQKCMMQQQEITHLKSTIESLERDSGDKVRGEEVAEMQRVIGAWQAQATEAQEELRRALKEVDIVRKDGQELKRNVDRLSSELKAAEAREKTLLGYWRQLQGVLSLGTTSPMPAEGVIGAVHRLREEKKKEAHARVEADRARAGVEKAARALAGGAGECQDLERRVDELIREKESKKAMVRELEADNAKAVEKLQRLSASRAHTEAAVLQEEVKKDSAEERLSKVEAASGRALEAESLRTALDDATAGREEAQSKVTRLRKENKEVVVARDEALRSNEDMRVKLRNFEDTLQGVSQETLVVLEKKEAVLRRVQEERKEEREAREREVQELRRSLEKSLADSSRLEADLAHARAAVTAEKENFASAETAAAGAAVAESAAKARVAVAIGARQDSEKRAAEARERAAEAERVLFEERKASARRLQEVEQACAELQMQVKTAEEVAKDEVRRGKAKLDELVTKRVEMTKRLLRQTQERHEAALANDKSRAEQRLMETIAAAETDNQRESAATASAALAALAREKDDALRQALDAKNLEVQRTRQETSAAIREAVETAKTRAAEAQRRAVAEARRQAAEAAEANGREAAAAARAELMAELADEYAEQLDAERSRWKVEADQQARATEAAENTKRAEHEEKTKRLSSEKTVAEGQLLRLSEKLSAARSAAGESSRALKTARGRVAEAEEERARAVESLEERLASAEREAAFERRRLLQSAEEAATAAELERAAVVAERDEAVAEVAREQRLAEDQREDHMQDMADREEAFSRRLEELAGEWKENMTAAVADARRAASTEVAAETRSAAAGELAEALEREKRESKRAVEAAVRRKDREMAKALKAAARLATKTQGDARVALEAEHQAGVSELQGQLERSRQDLEHAQRSQADQAHQASQAAQAAQFTAAQAEEEARLERDRIVREADDAAQKSAAAVSELQGQLERSRQDLEHAQRSQADQAHQACQAAQAAQSAAAQAEEEARLERDRIVQETDAAAQKSTAAVSELHRQLERSRQDLEQAQRSQADQAHQASRTAQAAQSAAAQAEEEARLERDRIVQEADAAAQKSAAAVSELHRQLERSRQDLERAQRSQADQAHQASRTAKAAQAAAARAEEEARLERDRIVREADDAAQKSAVAVDVAERRAEQAEAAVDASADKVRAVEKEAQYLRERLETIPGEIKTENNRAWEQREQKLREAVGAEVRAQADAEATEAQAAAKTDLEAALARQSDELAASHRAALRDAVGATAAEKDVLLSEIRQSATRLEGRSRLAEGALEEARSEGQAARAEAADARRAARKLEELAALREKALGKAKLAVAVATAAAADELVAAVKKEKASAAALLEEAARNADELHRRTMEETTRRFAEEKRELTEAAAVEKTGALAEVRVELAQGLEAGEREHRLELDRAMQEFEEQKRVAVEEALGRALKEREEAETAMRRSLQEEFQAEHGAADVAREEERTRVEEERAQAEAERCADVARQHAQDKADAVKAATEARSREAQRKWEEERRALQGEWDAWRSRDAFETARRHTEDTAEAVTVAVEEERDRLEGRLREDRKRFESAAARDREDAVRVAVEEERDRLDEKLREERKRFEAVSARDTDDAVRVAIEEERDRLDGKLREDRARFEAAAVRDTEDAVRVAVEEERNKLDGKLREERTRFEAAATRNTEDAVRVVVEEERGSLDERLREERKRFETAAVRDKEDAVRVAVGEERKRVEGRLREELERSEAAAELAVREATVRTARRGDEKVVVMQRQLDDEEERRKELEAAMKRAAKEWEVERTNALKAQQLAHQEALETALSFLTREKDEALQTATMAAAEKSASETESARKSAAESIRAAEERARMTREEAEETRRKAAATVAGEVEEARRALEEVRRVRKEAEVAMEEERAVAFEEMERLRSHSAELADTLRRTQEALTAAEHPDRAQMATSTAAAAAKETQTLRRKTGALEREASELRHEVAMRNAQLREAQHREETAVAAAAAAAAAAENGQDSREAADAALRAEREALSRGFEERLRVVLEERERQHTEVLRAALARSDAALGEVARVKEAMWAKAEDNAEALREAFEEASARAAEEAELATAEALAHADREHQGKLAVLTRALAERNSAAAIEGMARGGEEQAAAVTPEGGLASASAALPQKDTITQETLRSALAAQRLEHERRLEAALAARDAEALEALRLLDQQHKRGKHSKSNSQTGDGGGRESYDLSRSKTANSRRHLATTTTTTRSSSSSSSSNSISSNSGDRKRPALSSSSVPAEGAPPPSPAATTAASVPTGMNSSNNDDKNSSNNNNNNNNNNKAGGNQKRDRRRPRPQSISSSRQESMPSPSAPSPPALPPSRLPRSAESGGGVGTVGRGGGGKGAALTAAAMIAAEAAARDAALREAREESDRLEEEGGMSPEFSSERSGYSWSVPTTATGSPAGSGAGGGGATTAARLMMHAPSWTVGQDSSPSSTGRQKESPRRSSQNSGDAGRAGGVGLSVAGAGAGSPTTGLTVREERYKRELEGLRTRVRELEGMMECRLEERERAYRRKLRAAVAECRSLKVREHGAVRSTSSRSGSVDKISHHETGKLSTSDLTRSRRDSAPGARTQRVL